MARISSYNNDNGLTGNDLLLGSSFEGNINGVQKYATRTYRLSDLAAYFSGFVGDGSGGAVDLNDILDRLDTLEISVGSILTTITNIQGSITDIEGSITSISTTITELTTSIATFSQSITNITNEFYSQSTFTTNLASEFGVFDEFGNLISLSQAFANQVLQVTTSDRYANAQFVTNLAASVGVYDPNGNLITLSEAFANQVLQVTTTDKFATAEFATNLAASFGTYNPDGTLATISESFANQLLQASTASDFANATFLTNLASNFGTFDENGNLITISSSYANQLLQTANTSEFATATFVTNLGSSFGTLNPNGSIATLSEAFANQVLTTTTSEKYAESSFVTNLGASIGTLNPDGTLAFNINSSYSQGIKNYIENNSAVAQSIETLQAIYSNIPVTIRQPDEPPTLDIFNDLAYPLGSIWVDTDDNNALYVLIEDAGAPSGYSWSPTTSEALGDLILSNSQLQQQVNILSTNVSTEATKLDTLRSKFGYFDVNTGEFIVENSSEVISSLRTYADAQSTSAKKVDGLNSVFNMVDANGNVIKNLATFNQEITTYVDANSATASKIDGINSVFNIVDANGNVIKNLAAFNQEITTYVDANSATAAKVSTLETEVDGNAAAISSEQQARANADAAIASEIDDLKAVIGDENSGLVASVQQASSVTASLTEGLKASYGLTVGAGNAISSMKLLAEDPLQPGLPPTSSIIFNTGSFKIQNGSGVDQFTINTTTGKAEFSGHLQAATGTFTGELQAGFVNISNNRITVNSGGDMLFRDVTLGGPVDIGSIVPSVIEIPLYQVINGQLQQISSVNIPTITISVGGDSDISAINLDGRVNVSGQLQVGGPIAATGNITAFASDDRLKTRYENIKDPLAKIKKINGFHYKFNDLAAKVGLEYEPGFYVGVSAQEIEEVLPEVVHPAPFDTIKYDGKTYSKSGQNYKTVQYEKIVPLLIEGIKELVDEVEILKEEIKKLKG